MQHLIFQWCLDKAERGKETKDQEMQSDSAYILHARHQSHSFKSLLGGNMTFKQGFTSFLRVSREVVPNPFRHMTPLDNDEL